MVSPDLAKLLQDSARVAEVPAEAIPRLLGELAQLKAVLWVRMMNAQASGTGQAEASEERLFTAEQVAERLQIPKGHVYELARRGEIPTVRFGKYVRVSDSALREWVARHRENGLDKPLYTMYSRPNLKGRDDGRRTPTNPKAARANSGSLGGAARRHSHDGSPMGERRGRDTRADSPVDPVPSEDRAEDHT